MACHASIHDELESEGVNRVLEFDAGNHESFDEVVQFAQGEFLKTNLTLSALGLILLQDTVVLTEPQSWLPLSVVTIVLGSRNICPSNLVIKISGR